MYNKSYLYSPPAACFRSYMKPCSFDKIKIFAKHTLEARSHLTFWGLQCQGHSRCWENQLSDSFGKLGK